MSNEAVAARAAAHAEHVDRYRWVILLGLITAAVMEVLDTTIINVALPRMAGNLSATQEEIAWVSTSYILANVVVLPMTAFFTATFGRKNYLTFSIILFIFASFLCGTSSTLGQIVAWRLLQGAGGGRRCRPRRRRCGRSSRARSRGSSRRSSSSASSSRPRSARRSAGGSRTTTP